MKEKIMKILKEIRFDGNFENSKDFVLDGLIDSFDIVALVSNLNNEFNVNIKPSDIMPENFCSIDAIIKTIKKYQN